MGRLNYSEDEDYPGQFNLWRGNMARSLAGKKGQQALRDLEAALLALPEKRLIGHSLVKGGDVCANGALVELRRERKLGMSREQVLEQMREETAFACSTCWHQKSDHGLTCVGCDRRLATYLADGPQWLGQETPEPCKGYFVDESFGDDDDDDTQSIAEREGVPPLVATAIIEANDGWDGSHDRLTFDIAADPYPYGPVGPGRYVLREETPEERYDRVLRWVQFAQRDPREAAFRA